jgi:hypothetical protein
MNYKLHKTVLMIMIIFIALKRQVGEREYLVVHGLKCGRETISPRSPSLTGLAHEADRNFSFQSTWNIDNSKFLSGARCRKQGVLKYTGSFADEQVGELRFRAVQTKRSFVPLVLILGSALRYCVHCDWLFNST